MSYEVALHQLWEKMNESIEERTFAKLTLAKTIGDTEIKNVFMRPIVIDQGLKMETTIRYKTEEVAFIWTFEETLEQIKGYIKNPFLTLLLFTTEYDLVLKVNKKGMGTLSDKSPTFKDASLVMQELKKH